MGDRERILQAIENVANTFGGASRTLLLAIVREEKRLKRWEESQVQKAREQKEREKQKEYKATGVWPSDDDIPF